MQRVHAKAVVANQSVGARALKQLRATVVLVAPDVVAGACREEGENTKGARGVGGGEAANKNREGGAYQRRIHRCRQRMESHY